MVMTMSDPNTPIKWYLHGSSLYCDNEFDVLFCPINISQSLRLQHGDADPPIYPNLQFDSKKSVVRGEDYEV
jgi:hypothetical protein